jgi:predicted AlkP superfamily phosphohydrolase/phosphomutase
MSTTNGSRVLMIGLDSADIDYVESRLQSLPNLRRVFGEGIVRRLETPASVMAASAWQTFYTASDPGHHGHYFPIQWDPATMRLRHVAPDWLDIEPFWRPLAREGLEVTTLDVQMVFPNRTTAGVELVNWASPTLGPFECNRPEIGRQVERLFSKHVLDADIPVEKSPRRAAEIVKTLLAGVRRRAELVRWLMQHTSWDLFIAVFQECHRAGHSFWKDGDAPDPTDGDTLLEVYRALDAEVGTILQVAAAGGPKTSVVVFSLLGMGPNRAQMHLVPEVVRRINARFASSGASAAAGPPAKPGLIAALRDKVPAALQERIAIVMPVAIRDWVVARAYQGGIDWSSTPGFVVPTGGEGFIRVNLAGREAAGWIERDSAEHRRYLGSVSEGFLSLRKATGEPLVEAITAPAERFPGPRSQYLPDLSVTWRPGEPATDVRSDTLGHFSGRLKTGRPGNHRPMAFAAISGPAAATRRASSLATIVDLAEFVRDLVTDRA